MKANLKLWDALEEISFKYERMASLLESLRMLLTDGPVEIMGLPDNTIQYSLYEISSEMYDTNNKFKDIISNGEVIKTA